METKDICYGSISEMSIKKLIDTSDHLIDFFRERLDRTELDMFYYLLEVERELTLREEDPY